VVLDLAIAFVAILVVSLAVFLAHGESGANIGIALNMVLVANTTLLRLVESWTTLETSIGAAARLRELEDQVPSEEFANDIVVSQNWPSSGKLVLRDVRVCHGYVKIDSEQSRILTTVYRPRVTLDNLNLAVQDGQKVYICGETGR
jgi:ATP-binding cassette subfamily C (CFTR/MRP) protein 1